jgi:hypothetical protein
MIPVVCTWKINKIHMYAYNIFVGKPHGRVMLKWFVFKLFESEVDKPGSEFDDWEVCEVTVKKLL